MIETMPTLADVLTLAGAAIAATVVTGFVEVLKTLLPIIGARGLEQSAAIAAALVLVVLASVDRHLASGVTTPNDLFVSFVAWLAIAKLATSVHDELTAAPGSFRATA